MEYQIEVSRIWDCAHRGAPNVRLNPGRVYSVPEDVSGIIAGRCLASGIGRKVISKPKRKPKRAPSNKAMSAAPENKSL